MIIGNISLHLYLSNIREKAYITSGTRRLLSYQMKYNKFPHGPDKMTKTEVFYKPFCFCFKNVESHFTMPQPLVYLPYKEFLIFNVHKNENRNKTIRITNKRNY